MQPFRPPPRGISAPGVAPTAVTDVRAPSQGVGPLPPPLRPPPPPLRGLQSAMMAMRGPPPRPPPPRPLPGLFPVSSSGMRGPPPSAVGSTSESSSGCASDPAAAPEEASPPIGPLNVFVGKLPTDLSDHYVRNLLEKCGRVVSWKRTTDPMTAKPKGFGYCTFAGAMDVLRALRLLNGFSVDSKQILVKVDARTQAKLDTYEANLSETQREQAAAWDDTTRQVLKHLEDERSGLMGGIQNHPASWGDLLGTSAAEEEGEEEAEPAAKVDADPDAAARSRPSGSKRMSEMTGGLSGGDGVADAVEGGDDAARRPQGKQVQQKMILGEIEKFRLAQDQREQEQDQRRREAVRERLRHEQEEEKKREAAVQRQVEHERTCEPKSETSREDNCSASCSQERGRSRERRRRHLDSRRSSPSPSRSRSPRRSSKGSRPRSRSHGRDRSDRRRKTRARSRSTSRPRSRSRSRSRSHHRRRHRHHRSRSRSPRHSHSHHRGSTSKTHDREQDHQERRRRRHHHEDDALLERDITSRKKRHKDAEAIVSDTPSPSQRPRPCATSVGVDKPATTEETRILDENRQPNSKQTAANGDTARAPIVPTPKVMVGLKLALGGAAKKDKPAAISAVVPAFAVEEDVEEKPVRAIIPIDYSEEERLAIAPIHERVAATTAKLKHDTESVKALISQIPTEKDALFAFPINWSAVEKYQVVAQKMAPWVHKKVLEYVGEADATLITFVLGQLRQQAPPHALVHELQGVLDDEAEVFVQLLWRKLAFEALRATT